MDLGVLRVRCTESLLLAPYCDAKPALSTQRVEVRVSRSPLKTNHWKYSFGSKICRSLPELFLPGSDRSPRSAPRMVLSFILIQNRQGKTRLAKWYAPYTDEEKVKLKGEVCYLYLTSPNNRNDNHIHSQGPPPHSPPRPEIPVEFRRVPIRALVLHLWVHLARPTEPLKHEDRLQTLRWAFLLCLRGCE